MYILGLNAYHGDVSATLLRDGRVVAAVEEERFRRVKHWAGFPTMAIRSCLEQAGIDGREISHVAVSRDPRANLLRKVGFVLRNRPDTGLLRDRARNAGRIRDLKSPLVEALQVDAAHLPRIHYVEHHPSHLASAFLVSPYEEAAICAIDGFGDFVSTSIALGRGNRFDVLDRVFFPHSLGMMYTAVTQFLGFHHYGDEFKVMGLAPYGKPAFVDELRHLVHLRRKGQFELELKYFQHWNGKVRMEWEEGYPVLGQVFTSALEDLLGPARKPEEPVTERHEAIAHSLQAVYEECAFHILSDLWERTRLPDLCLAGGCAMNSVANGKIRANTPFERIYVQPAAGDNGTGLGAAYYVWNQILGKPRSFVMEHAYWGPPHDDFDPVGILSGRESEPSEFVIERYEDTKELCRVTAALIADGQVVGWYQGGMEWGARALGNRSILADPRRVDMRDRINTKIKFREKFRPFAPSIAEEFLDEYFVDASPDPFMQQVYPIRPEKRSVIPAVTHVDGTGRLQTVSPRVNQLYYQLIRAFGDLTGVPIVLNTSFNENEPIVNTPEEAFDCFLRTRMDAIVVNGTVVRRVNAGTDEESLGSSEDHASPRHQREGIAR